MSEIKKPNLIGISGKIGSGKDTIARIILWHTSNKRIYYHGEPVGTLENFLKLPEHPVSDKIANGSEELSFMSFDSPWRVVHYAGLLKKWVSDVTGISIEDLSKSEIKNSYLGDNWSYIKEQRYISDNGEVSIKPRKHSITVRSVLQKLGTEVARVIHSNFWINGLFVKYTSSSKWIVGDVRFINEAMAVLDREGIIIRVERDELLRLGYVDKNLHISETALDKFQHFTHIITNNGSIKELEEKVIAILSSHNLIK